MRTSIVVIGMFDSIHYARWLAQFKDEDIAFFLFPSSPHRRIRPELNDLLQVNARADFVLFKWHWLSLLVWFLDRLGKGYFRGLLLARFLARTSPNIVHAIELQGAGYALLEAVRHSPDLKFKVVVTNYGSDIFWFRKFPKHRQKLEGLLKITDLYAAECRRDLLLARQLGYIGAFHTVNPNAGGFSDETLSSTLLGAQQRKLIAVKGYQGWAGRGILALKAILKDRVQYKGLTVVVYSASASTAMYALLIRLIFKINLKVYRKGALSHDQVLSIFASSLIYVGVSETDGISTSMLEAMSQGAIPVQSATSCCEEWFESTGVVIQSNDVDQIRTAIREALILAKEDSNRQTNRQTLIDRANFDRVKRDNLPIYQLRNSEKDLYRLP